MRLCSVQGCGDKHYCHGYCIKHYSRNKKHGNPLGGRMFDGEQIGFLKAHVDTVSDACIDWPYSLNPTGYGRVKDGYVSRGAHRVMCRMAHGEPPTEEHHAAHSCHNRKCVNPRHLRWADANENVQDRVKAGRSARGENAGPFRLTEDQVRAIKSSDKPVSQLVDEYAVHKTTIYRIKRNAGWRHV